MASPDTWESIAILYDVGGGDHVPLVAATAGAVTRHLYVLSSSWRGWKPAVWQGERYRNAPWKHSAVAFSLYVLADLHAHVLPHKQSTSTAIYICRHVWAGC